MASDVPFRLEIPQSLFDAMLEQARSELPNECCGLLAGRSEQGVATVMKRYPLVNSAASPIEFQADPRDQFDAHRDMRKLQIDMLAIYHSHPTTPPVPSKTDLTRNFWGNEVVWLIVSLVDREPIVRGWWLEEATFREAEIVLASDAMQST